MDTRSAPRIPVRLEVLVNIDNKPDQSIKLAAGTQFDATVFDISSKGMGIFIKYFLPRETAIELVLAGAPFGLKDDMKIKSEVKYCNCVATHTYRCGVEFLDLPEEYKNTINSFITKYDRRQGPRLSLPTDPGQGQ